jgi:hypothetical protein
MDRARGIERTVVYKQNLGGCFCCGLYLYCAFFFSLHVDESDEMEMR